jgi:hypothetical protein
MALKTDIGELTALSSTSKTAACASPLNIRNGVAESAINTS